MIRVPTHREPTHPGEMLRDEFLAPLGLTQRSLADAIDVPRRRVKDVVNARRSVTPGLALRLAKYLGTSAELWLNLQERWDLYHAARTEAEVLRRIRPVQRSRRVA
ncbi:MAG: HigA family addiction module antitoxin [bacterium]